MPIFGQKNVNSIKTTLYYGPKKSIGCPFFPIFYEKIIFLMPIFYQKNVHSLKNTMLSCPHFVKKTSIFSITQCSHVIFLKYFMKNPPVLCPYLVNKRQFCQNYTILWAKTVNRMPFCFRFFTKKALLSCPYFVKKTSIL